MHETYDERIGAPWWLIVAAPLVMLVAVPVPLVGWFNVPMGTAVATAAVVAAVQAAVAIGVGTSVQVADGMLRIRNAIELGPLEIRMGRDRSLPTAAVRHVQVLGGKALADVRRRLTSPPTREALYGDRISYEPGSAIGYMPGRSVGLHLAVTGTDGRPQERLVFSRDPDGLVRALGHPSPPPVLEEPPVPLPDGSMPAPDPLAAYHPRERKRREAGPRRDVG